MAGGDLPPMPTPAEYQAQMAPAQVRTTSVSSQSSLASRSSRGGQHQQHSQPLYQQSEQSPQYQQPMQFAPQQQPQYYDPQQQYHQQQPMQGRSSMPPSQQQYRPVSSRSASTIPIPPVPQPVDPLHLIFLQVDTDRSGELSVRELRSALVNFDKTKFDIETVKLMIQLFDFDLSGTINFEEFKKLWEYLGQWLERFNQFDSDHNGTISHVEFAKALAAFGYQLSPDFIAFMFAQYDKRGTSAMSFDLFVQANIALSRMSAAFAKYDIQSNGIAQIRYEDFLREVINLK